MREREGERACFKKEEEADKQSVVVRVDRYYNRIW
jgi:hypothetical protein